MTNRKAWPAIALRWGKDGFEIFIQQGVFTQLPITLASVAITWLLAGLLLYLLYARRINAANALTWIGFFLVSLVYLNVLRERFRYGDISYFHDTSFDSLLHFPTQIFPFPDSLARVLVYGAKGILLMAVIMVLVRTVRTQAFLSDAAQSARLFNAMPPLFILMTLASPVV